ncbi:MAG: glycosyltransferase [Thalassobaculum sp.]|uniref:glycosyltransferase n=1 Tax=Thalassobaculum sp. TaxID=2022740 RepID=UPI0032EBAD97
MRVLSMLAGAATGGAETFFVTLVTAFAGAGIEQRVVIRRNPVRAGLLRDAGVPVREAAYGRWLDLGTRLALRQEVRAFDPDVAIAFMSRAADRMPAGRHLKLARLGGFYDIKYYRRCDHLVCITHGIRRHVIAQGWPEDRAHYLGNFAEADDAPAADRAAHDTPADAPLVFTPCRLHGAKAIDVLLKAVAKLDGVYLWVAGDGPDRAALAALADELGVASRVRFLGWQVATGPFFRAADVVAFPSRHEPFGTVSLEAWAYGKPLVTTDVDGPAELVRPEQDAVMVPRDDVEALAGGLRRVIEDKALATRLVEAGHARHAAEFTRDICVANYLALFDRLR